MLIYIEENYATLTPFGSLVRIPANVSISPSKVNSGRIWTAKLRAVLALLFR